MIKNAIPGLSVTPSAFNFGSIALGASSPPQSFTLQNIGTEDLRLGTITVEGPHALEFDFQSDNCSGQTLAPAARCSLEVAFAPTTAGTKTGVLTIPVETVLESHTLTLQGFGNQSQSTPPPSSSGSGCSPGGFVPCSPSFHFNPNFFGPEGGGCFVATVAFGSPMAKEIQILRAFRDASLMPTRFGRTFMAWYYRYSPPVADFLRNYELLRRALRLTLLPVVADSHFWLTGSAKQQWLAGAVFTLLILALGTGIGRAIQRYRRVMVRSDA